MIVDEQFGPLVMVAAGGTLIEVRPDRRLALPPVDRVRALAMVDHLSVRPLLDGVRGTPPVDLEALSQAIIRMSVLAIELGERLVALDANPVVCGPGGCVAVDALVIPRRPA